VKVIDLSSLIGIAEVIGIVVTSILYVMSRLPKQTIKNQGELISALEKRLEEAIKENDLREARSSELAATLYKKNAENVQAINELNAQVNMYKTLPLLDIQTDIRTIQEQNATKLDILSALVSGVNTLTSQATKNN
jgi:uncharacterized membrane-anchored protein YhcB (DUF1043 family)